MKCINKSVLVLIGLLCLLSLIVYSPSIALAAKTDKASKVAKADLSDKLGEPNAAFDINKMSDMSDFDPAHPVIPTGDVIKIAHVAPFSGPGALNGELHYAPMLWAVHDINKRGGIWVDGKKKLVALIQADSMSKPDQAKKVCERMILQEKAQFLVGTSGSNIMKVMNETGNKYKVIIMNEGALSDDLMDATNFNRYAFMSSASTEQIGRGLAYYYGQIRKKEKKFYIIGQDYSFGHGLGDGFKKGLKEYYPEAQIVGEDYHKLFLTDFAPYLEKIKASGAEVIYTGDWTPDSGNLLKQARQMGIKLPFANLFMNEPNELHEVGIEGTKGLVNIDQHDVTPAFKYPGYDKFHKAWNGQWQKWKTQPFNSRVFEHDSSNLGSYTMQMYWLLSVIERAKSTDPEKIIKVWEGDSYRFANGKVIKMRTCDHKAMQNLTVTEYVPPEQQKVSFNIPPYYWFKGCSYSGPGHVIPAGKVLPQMDQKLDRCTGKNGWGE
jgi:ABC-type branched-subunit amino acid transport system substrate-binding protein